MASPKLAVDGPFNHRKNDARKQEGTITQVERQAERDAELQPKAKETTSDSTRTDALQ
jgi:hypothetical protein